MFNLQVIRHRIFEIHNFRVTQPRHKPHKGYVKDGYYVTVAGNGGNNSGHNYTKLRNMKQMSKLEIWRHAMKITWMTTDELRQAIPPAYSRYIGEHLH